MTKTVAHANNQTLLLFLWKSLGKRLKTNWVNQRGKEWEGRRTKEKRDKNKGGELERRKRTNRRGGGQ